MQKREGNVLGPRGVAIPFATLVVLAVGVQACASILGLDDRTLESVDGSTFDVVTTPEGSTGSSSSASTSDGAAEASIRDSGLDATDATDGAPLCPLSGVNVPCVLATGVNKPWAMAADQSRVYWTEYGSATDSNDGAVKSCSINGCPAGATVYVTGVTNPRTIAVDANNVYWVTIANNTISVPTLGGVWSCPISGCGTTGPKLLASATTPYGLVIDDVNVYWVDQNDRSVHRTAKAGTDVDHVLNDGSNAPWGVPQKAAADNAFVYFTDDDGGVYRVPFDGGASGVVSAGNDAFGDHPVVVDSNYVYYGASNFFLATGTNSDFVFRIAKGSNPNDQDAQVPLVSNLYWSYALVLESDAGRLYWGDLGDDVTPLDGGQVGRVNVTGGGLFAYGSNLSPIRAIAVNGSYVFWGTYAAYDSAGNFVPNTGTIVRVIK